MHPVVSRLTVDVAAPASAVWDLLADFGAVEKWWPKGILQKVVCEGDGPGMIRHLHVGPGIVLEEQLDQLYPDQRRLTLSIRGDMPAGISNYHAEGRVLDVGQNACQLAWEGHYEVPDAESETAARGFIEMAYAAQAQGVKSYLET